MYVVSNEDHPILTSCGFDIHVAWRVHGGRTVSNVARDSVNEGVISWDNSLDVCASDRLACIYSHRAYLYSTVCIGTSRCQMGTDWIIKAEEAFALYTIFVRAG